MDKDLQDNIYRFVAHDEPPKFNIVSPWTSFDSMEEEGAEGRQQRREYLYRDLEFDDDVKQKLIEQFLENNREKQSLQLPAVRGTGFIVDYDGKFNRYFDDDEGGWDALYPDYPNADGYYTVSMPAYDPESSLVLIYCSLIFGLFGADEGLRDVYVFHYRDHALSLVTWEMIWMT
jgi:hypothetical protein